MAHNLATRVKDMMLWLQVQLSLREGCPFALAGKHPEPVLYMGIDLYFRVSSRAVDGSGRVGNG